MNTKKEFIETMGVFFGALQGFILAKVYLSWAVLHRTYGMGYAGSDGWYNTPIWVFSIENPTIFLLIVVGVFGAIGLFISKMSIRHFRVEDALEENREKLDTV